MKIDDLEFEDKNDWLKTTDLEVLFNIFQDARNNYVYNLNTTLYFNINSLNMSEYTCDHDMFWPLISYKLYNTTRLAWLLMKINDVNAKTIFDIKHSGDKINYLPLNTVKSIIEQINSVEE